MQYTIHIPTSTMKLRKKRQMSYSSHKNDLLSTASLSNRVETRPGSDM